MRSAVAVLLLLGCASGAPSRPDADSDEELLEVSQLGVTIPQPESGALRPTLFIGLGSFGRKALLELRCRFIDRFGDMDGDGFVEYARGTETGLANQGWKDSHDSISYADGALATGPIALVEVQAYVFAARRAAAACARRLGFLKQAETLEAQAELIRRRFEEAFWCEELGTYALALDGDKQPCKVRTSNAGQLLFTGIVETDRARRVAADLMSSKFFSGWGIRTEMPTPWQSPRQRAPPRIPGPIPHHPHQQARR